jgi:site-specific DNA-methyltransferase (cytosine-N4-specific)
MSNKHVQTNLIGERIEEDWNFAKASTSYLTHGLHEYPARMIPQIAKRLILAYSRERAKILDPFCGSGTTLVEARLAKRYSVGVDINPFAVLLSKVKATPIDFRATGFNLAEFLKMLESDHANAKRKGALPDPPIEIFRNLLHWFKESVTRDLEFLYQKIEAVENNDIKDLLRVAFSDTAFRTSNIDLRSSRFIRTMPKEKLIGFNPDVIAHFKKKSMDCVRQINLFTRKIRGLEVEWQPEQPVVSVIKEDAKNLRFKDEQFDVAITSPPYGEEKNTVGYSRWAKLSLMWLRLDGNAIKESERQTLGAISAANAKELLEALPSSTASNLMKGIFKHDESRIKDALPFFFDYLTALKEMHRILRPQSYCCIVIGDRAIRKKRLDMEKVTVELAKDVGFSHKTSFFREIPQKLIPWATPTGKTISKESIVILGK